VFAANRSEDTISFQKALQNRSFVKFLRYCKIEILTYVKYAPVSSTAGGLALNCDKIPRFAKPSLSYIEGSNEDKLRIIQNQ